MKKMFALFLAPFIFFNGAAAQNPHAHHALNASEFTATTHTQTPLKEDTLAKVTIFLADQKGQGIGVDQLKTVHTEKVHALIIDPTLTDYQHVHPTVGKKTGDYNFSFTPRTPNNYRIWLDVTPVNGAQQYVMTDLSGVNTQNPPVVKTLSTQASVDQYHFKLTFDRPLTVGQEVMGSVVITDKQGNEVKQLEPIMEAFAHIVAFSADYRTILHVHPMGAVPKNQASRGGPRIDFHMKPSAAGFVKLFVQVKINGQELFAPFGVEVLS